MGVKYEVTAVTGEYQNHKGETKKRYARLGVVLDTKNGPMLKLETIPLKWDGFAYLNEPRDKAEQQPRQDDDGDPIPF